MKEFKIRTSLEPNIFNFSIKMDSSFLIVDTIHSIIVFIKSGLKQQQHTMSIMCSNFYISDLIPQQV